MTINHFPVIGDVITISYCTAVLSDLTYQGNVVNVHYHYYCQLVIKYVIGINILVIICTLSLTLMACLTISIEECWDCVSFLVSGSGFCLIHGLDRFMPV